MSDDWNSGYDVGYKRAQEEVSEKLRNGVSRYDVLPFITGLMLGVLGMVCLLAVIAQ